MKKGAVVAVVAGLVIAYPASSWVLGRQVHGYFEEEYQKLADNSLIKVQDRKIESGVFESVETVTFEFMPALFGAMLNAKSEPADPAAPPPEPIRFTTRSTIKHGPFPGLAAFGAGVVHTELVLDNPRHPLLAKLYGDKTPLTIDTTVGFGGGGHQVMLSPAVDTTLEDNSHMSWGEIQLASDFTRGMASYTMTGGAPFFKLASADGSTNVEVTALAIDGKQARLFEDNASFYTGPVQFTVAKVDVRGPDGRGLSAEQLRFASDTVSQGEFLDITASYGFQSLKLDTENVGPSQLDIGLRHLHAKALADAQKEYMNLIYGGKLVAAGNPPDLSLFKPLAKPFKTLLEGSPEFAIDKFEVQLPEGNIAAKVSVRLPNAKIGDLEAAAENPLVLMGLVSALETDGQIAVPEALVLAATGEGKAAMIPAMIQEGYLINQNGTLSTTFKYATGQLVINGKKLDPSMFQTAAPAAAPAVGGEKPVKRAVPMAPISRK